MKGRMTRVKAALRTREELCSLSDFYGDVLSNGRNDVSALRSCGWIIESRWERHGKDGHKHYRLISEASANPVQLALGVRASA